MTLSPRDLLLIDVELEYRRRVEAGEIVEGPRAMVEYQRRPVEWLVEQMDIPIEHIRWSASEAYGDHVWDGTEDPFALMFDALANYDTNGIRGIACESGTTTGKTVWLAWAILWFQAVFKNAIVVTVAPKEDQLRYHVWKQITAYWPRFQRLFPGAKKDTLRIQMVPGSDEWGAIGFVAGVGADEVAGAADKAKGFHSPHMLIAYEEMTGVHKAIREAFKRTCRAPHNLQIGVGNPVHQYDELHRFAVAPGTLAVRISALDHPNIVTGDDEFIPGAVSGIGLKTALQDVKGNEKDPEYLASVRGISPSEAKTSLIKRVHLERAVIHAAKWEEQYAEAEWPQALGGDPANSTSGDPAGWCRFVGPVCVEVHAEACPNANIFGADLWQTAKDYRIEPQHIGIDPIGVGAGTVNEMRRLQGEGKWHPNQYIPQLESGGASVQRIAKPGEGQGWVTDANRFSNLRAQMYWQLALDLANNQVGLPEDEELFEELLAVTYETRGRQVVMLEKKKIKELIGRSPNKGDCVVYANWVRPRTTPIDHGHADPDHASLGFRKTRNGVRPLTVQDLNRPLAVPSVARGVKKYWGKR